MALRSIGVVLGLSFVACSEKPRDEVQILEQRPTNEDPAVADGAVLKQMVAAGADLSKPTHIIHYAYFKDEPSAVAARGLVPESFGREVVRGEAEWALKVDHTDVPSLANITRVRELLTGIAAQKGGSYDGWEAAIR